MDIQILIAVHKKYKVPHDAMYLPIHVGKKGKNDIGFIGDDTGDNISDKNAQLCELTGMYWAWKNSTADYMGLVHYRRYFTNYHFWQRIGKDKFKFILAKAELEQMLQKYDLILPKPRRYYIESMYSHFVHLPYTFDKDLLTLKKVIMELQPDYVEAFDIVMSRSHAHMFNMFIMKQSLHGGTITAESEENKVRFVISLPVKP